MVARPPPPRRAPPPPTRGPAPRAEPGPKAARAPAAAAPRAAAASRAVEEDRPLPQTFFLGRYRVVDEIGVGGMASVHLARVDGPGGFQKWIAIKRIHPHLVEDDQFVDMFLDEARIAAGINHANVAQVFDLGKDDNTYWIAMEYLHGEPLREIMRRAEEVRTTVPPHIAARICADAAEGLHAAHELRGRNGQLLNLVHRDVTPHNLFVTYDGYTKVVDFGIAKVIDRLASTRAGTLKGKLAYMSPEQVRGHEVDRRTDIFALGVVLWELTTNERLFRMETDLDTLEKVQACVVPLPSTRVPGYPRELEQVVMTALAPRPEQRFQTSRDFSRALQRYLMSAGFFVGPEDVGEYAKGLFAERVQKREKYLEWAAEVTSTVDVEALRAQQGGGSSAPAQDMSAVQGRAAPVAAAPVHQQARPAPAPTHVRSTSNAGGVATSAPALTDLASTQIAGPELAASSLVEEDEEIPTVVAMRDEEMNNIGRPRPAAGYPAASPQPQAQQPQTQQPYAQQPYAQQPVQAQAPQWPHNPSQVTDLQSTIALPDAGQALEIQQALAAAPAARAPMAGQGAPAPGYGAPHAGYGAAPQQAPEHPAAQTLAFPSAVQAPMPQPIPAPAPSRPQSAVETRMSMPRPAAVAEWAAEDGAAQLSGPRGMGVLASMAMLAALCAMCLAALVVFKVRTPPAQAATVDVKLSADDEPKALVPADIAKVVGGVAAGPASAKPRASASATTTATTDTTATVSGTAATATAPATGGGSPPPPPPSSDMGTLNVSCSPGCDQIIIDGRSFSGSSASAKVSPGQKRVTGKRKGYKDRTLSVMIMAGESLSKVLVMKEQ